MLFYRAHESSGNSAFAHALADAIDATGEAVGVPIFSTSLRSAPDDLYDALGTLDALVVTVLAAGGTKPSTASAGGDDEAWDVERMKALDIPILQGLCLTSSREAWAASDEGVTPLDSANQIAIPEFDGRIITVPFSFKEIDEDGLPRYVADPERCARVAGIAVAHARLRHVPPRERKIALMLSAYPTKHSRVGNAVGLDTPVSTVRLLRRLRDAGYDLGPPGAIPGLDLADDTEAGDALIHALIAAGGQDEEWLTAAQLSDSHVRIGLDDYRRWTADLPAALMDDVNAAWGEAPGRLFVNDQGEIVLATITAGNVVLLIQPPRGFGENPVAIYHDPDLAPSHHYLAAYRWLGSAVEAGGFGAHAVVHLGKHGSMEWLPGKNAAMSAACATDAAIGNLPLVYPFLVNDPGEGAQAKRRAHATIVDHLIPPMARAESYGDIAKLEQLLDEHANIAAMDPAKLPAIRAEIWTLMHAAEMHRDLGLDERPDDDSFDDFVLHVDGWLCEVKDAQIRDGLHILGQAPEGEARVNLVLSILRAAQVWGGETASVPGLRAALGLKEGCPSTGSGTGVCGRCGRGARPGRWSSGWRRPGGSRTPPTSCTTTPRSAESCASRPPRWCRGWPGRPTSWTPYSTRWTAASCPPGPPAPRCGDSSTCSRPAGTSTRSTRARCRPDWPGRPVSRWPTPSSSATSTTPAPTRSPSASRSGARPRCARPATTSPKSLPCWVFGPRGTWPHAASTTWRSCRSRSWAGHAST